MSNLFYKRTFVLKKLACFIIALCLTSALFSQVAPWGDNCVTLDSVSNNCPPINCPPLSTAEARTYRGTQLALEPEYMDCPISTTPGEPIAAPTITCPVKSIEYSIIEPTTSGAFRQYKSFASPDGNGYGASSQGWINQLYCHKDPVFGLPAPTDSTGFTYIAEYDDIVSSLPAREPRAGDPADSLRDISNAQLIQFDFWLLLPPTVPTVGLQVGETSADATVLMLGPDLNNMCPVAEFIEIGRDDDGNKVGFGDKTGYYTIPTTGVSQTCNANILRARIYITDIAAVWNSMPLLDIGNGFENLTNLPVIATTSGDDNILPIPTLDSIGIGYEDANGNVFDINGNWIPVACRTPGTDATDIAASTVGLSGSSTICSGDAAPDYTITGLPGSMVTYNIDGGTDIVITLDATTGMASIPASNTVSSTFNLVSVNFDNGNSCDLSSTASVTVDNPTLMPIDTAVCSGTTVDVTPSVFSMSSPAGGDLSYHGSAADATNDANPLTGTTITQVSTSDTIYLRYELTTGCFVTDSIEVLVNDNPTLMTIDTAVCSGTMVDVTASVFSTGNPAGGDLSYHGSAGDATNDASPLTGTAITEVTSGKTYIRYELSTGCFVTDSIEVTVNPNPTLVTIDTTVCSGEMVDITASVFSTGSPAGGDLSYHGSAGDATNDATPLTGTTITEVTSGKTYVRYELSTGCFVTDSIEVTVNPNPTLVTIDTAVCSGTMVDITASVFSTSNPAGGDLSYHTTAIEATMGINALSGTAITEVTTSSMIYVRYELGTGCFVTDLIEVTVNDNPICSITGSATAVENTQDAPYMGPAGMTSYTWSVAAGDATIDGSTTSQNVSIDFGSSNSTLQLTIIDGNDCTATCTFNITVEAISIVVPSVPNYTWTFLDPCNCANPDNITLSDGTILIADFIQVDASQYTSPTVSISEANTNFLDNTGVPIDIATANFTDQGGGVFELPYYTRPNARASFIIDVNGDRQEGTSTNCSPCRFDNVPTLSQWGFLIYGLLILNLFIFALYRKELVCE